MATEAKIAGEAARAAGAGILAARADAAGEQVELFGLPVADESGDVAAAAGRVARGPGRPEGASNKATVALREHLLRKGVLPQQALMQWVMLGPDGLAIWMAGGRESAVTAEIRAIAFKEWAKVAGDLGKYFMAPMSPQDAQGNSVPFMNFQFLGAGAVDAAGNAVPPWILEAMKNQQVTKTIDGESQSQESKE